MMNVAADRFPFRAINEALAFEMDLLNKVWLGEADLAVDIWQTNTCLVAPKSFKYNDHFERAVAHSSRKGWPVHLRSTGGDVTPQGPGIVNLTVVWAPPENQRTSVKHSYSLLCQPILDALFSIGLTAGYGEVLGAFCNGAYNINIEGRKFAGTAQRWKKHHRNGGRVAILFHALLIVDMPKAETISAVNRFLSDVGKTRKILPLAHTGLSDHLSSIEINVFFNEVQMRLKTQLPAKFILTPTE